MKNKIMLSKTIKQLLGLVGMAAIAATLLVTAASAGGGPAPAKACAFGRSLAEWQDTYFRWFAGELNIPPDANGNSAVRNIVLMPLPNAPGDGTPGHLDVTLAPGQGFTLPLLFFLGTSYTDGTPNDPLVDRSFFETLDITVKVAGVTVVNNANKMNYYSEFFFAPAIPINSPPINSVIWCEDLGLVHGPLSVGTHTIKVDVKSTQALPPNFGGTILEHHNTWTVTVKP